ncbi:MAG: PLP-dependent transferase [Bacillati bacterium ANGP1]|uniref:homocysteine desulfhydrase n=1 Tax=Candidatus Segetimicrobium genomatis TaxID=2569760 RepID=A0A537K6R4_9BACT|nr:MAG: PLP-dependent transferase [Terrabacteria group bacterium ANGP1]
MGAGELGFSTRAIHGGKIPDANKSVVAPMYQTATFRYDTVEEGARLGAETGPGYFYTRWGNPTTDLFEQKMALLEGGEAALATSSGMAAIATAVMSLLRAGDHVVAPKAVYQATFGLFDSVLPGYGVEATFLDDPDVGAYERALRPNTRLLYIETPNNPLLGVIDIAGVVALARARGARTIADNTFATPYNQTPLALGVDLVCHSATKYLGGHHDVTAGVIVGSRDLIRGCVKTMRIFGGVLDPFAAFLLVRGLMTLGLRVERHNASALALARHLADHPKVARVHYPGLPGHPRHAVAARQMTRGFGGMLSLEVRGDVAAGARCVEALRVAKLAVSLGGVSTLVTHPASTTSVNMPREVRLAAGIADGLIRVSVGVEDLADLIADVDQALDRV